jgi:hypothetical protein
MEEEKEQPASVPNRPPNRIGLILLVILLIGGLGAVSVLFQQNLNKYDMHDHDRDGTPDHGTDAH